MMAKVMRATISLALMQHLQSVAVRRDITPSEVFRQVIRGGLLIEHADRDPHMEVLVREGSNDPQVMLWDDPDLGRYRDMDLGLDFLDDGDSPS